MLTPEQVVLAEARRSYTTLSLFGYRVDGVVANRVFPAGGADPWRAGWVAAQGEVLGQVAESFAGVGLWRSPYRPAEPVGVEALGAFGRALYGDRDPLAVPPGTTPSSVTTTERGSVMSLPLPFATRAAGRPRSASPTT